MNEDPEVKCGMPLVIWAGIAAAVKADKLTLAEAQEIVDQLDPPEPKEP